MDYPLGSHVSHNAARFPNKIALIDEAGQLSYGQLEAAANRIAHALSSAGFGKGDNIALLAKSDIPWVTVLLGIVKAGSTAVPLNYRLTAHDIAATVADSESKLVFVGHECSLLVADVMGGARIIWIDGTNTDTLNEFVTGQHDEAPQVEIAPSDIQLIMYTGGTTGKSKGVMLSHENVMWNNLNEIIDTDMCEDDNTILATPLHHAAALNCWLLPHLYLGATGTILKEYSPEKMLRMIAKHKVTNGFSPPSMARDLYSCPLARELDLSSFRRWYVGGATMSVNDRDAMHALLPEMKIYYQYGITEAGPIVTVLKEKDYARAPGTIGRAFVNIEVKILRDDFSDAAFGEVGEIVVRGRPVMLGYYKQPEATAAAFHDGWLRTGDLGAMDESGFVTFHDRLKDMVKTGGLNVFSQEVEQALQKFPALREIAIIGIPSEKWGEEVVGVAVLRDGYNATTEEIIAFGRASLASYKLPKRIFFFEYKNMPINYSGKIMKRELREILRRNLEIL